MNVFELADAGVRVGERWALRHITLSIGRGERVGLIGPSGAGKTTLLRLLGAVVAPSEGSARLFGYPVATLNSRSRRALQARIGTVHQHLDLVGPLAVIHNVNAGNLGRWSLARAAAALVSPPLEPARRALERVGLADRIQARTDALSGGEQQRVALARVLVQRPEVVLADEPVSHLDPALSSQVMELLRDQPDGVTVVVSVHEYAYALSHCSRVLGLREGRLVFDARPEVIDEPMLAELYSLERR